MSNATRNVGDDFERTAAALAELVQEAADVLFGLRALRQLDSPNDRAIEAVLAIPEVNRVRLGWELLEVLSEGAGIDSEALIGSFLDPYDMHLAREALWASGPEGTIGEVA